MPSDLQPPRFIRNVLATTPEEDSEIVMRTPPKAAAGIPSIITTFQSSLGELGLIRTTQLFASVNQKDGFDCTSCAWPDPDGERSRLEFCENGARAFAEEATTKRVTREFFSKWNVEQLSLQSDHWLGHQGRLTEPMVLRPGSLHYEPISWDDAFKLIAGKLRNLESPDESIFYTSGRASNEAAFLYQLFVRRFGTNNLPDCSNMCHESSSLALNETLGTGKSTARLDDLESADCILLFGINPGSNMPRMLTSLAKAVDRGAQIIAINPLPELGLMRFGHPQEVRGVLGNGVALASQFLQLKINGDVALIKGVMKCLVAKDKVAKILDHEFIEHYCSGFDEFLSALDRVSWDDIVQSSGVAESDIRRLAETLACSRNTVACWSMGLTQHSNGVANIQELVNLMLLQGNLGRPHAGLFCVRGHSNVQGDRTMGIWEKPSKEFLDQLERVFHFSPPRTNGLDTVGAIEAMADGRSKVFVGLGGNFLSATPDTLLTAASLQQCLLTVQISTKLNRSHLVTGETALILPCLGRTERDAQQAGEQFVSTENSTCQIRSSIGRLDPASVHLRSEIAIIGGIAKATLGEDSGIDWEHLVGNYDVIRDCVEQVVPGFERYNSRVREPGGFYLRVPSRERDFRTSDGMAHFTTNEIPLHQVNPNRLVMMTIRSHSQFNTTVYGFDDRYRGVSGGRRVIFMNAGDIAEANLSEGQWVDLTSYFRGEERHAPRFRIVTYSIPRGFSATYYPETNVLVSIGSRADGSNTPAFKFIEVSVTASSQAPVHTEAAAFASGARSRTDRRTL